VTTRKAVKVPGSVWVYVQGGYTEDVDHGPKGKRLMQRMVQSLGTGEAIRYDLHRPSPRKSKLAALEAARKNFVDSVISEGMRRWTKDATLKYIADGHDRSADDFKIACAKYVIEERSLARRASTNPKPKTRRGR
jgi:hypothetical protein